MSDVPRQITGTLRAPDGVPIKNRTLTWYRADRRTVAQGASVIVDELFRTATDGAGQVDVAVVPGHYLVLVRLADQDRYFEVGVPEGAGPALIQDLVDTSAPVITPPLVAAAEAARDAAVVAQGLAEAARNKAQDWAEKSTAPGGSGTKSAKTWATEASGSAGAAQADRVQTGLDRVATGADRVQTGADRTQTGLDRVATGGDRTQTGLDRAAAETARNKAQDWAEKTTAPGGSGTKSAKTWAGEASASALAASGSEGNAAATLKDFAARYLGAKAAPPATDNDGQPLVAGALYWNTTAGEMRAWDGTAWLASYLPVAGLLEAAANLADLADIEEARDNLGLEAGATAEKAGQSEAKAGTDDAKFMTPARTFDAVRELAIGEGQEWQDLTSSRSYGTSYQNTTGRTITLCLLGPETGGGGWVQVSKNGSSWLDIGYIGMTGAGDSKGTSTTTWPIPPNIYYRVSGGVKRLWWELR